MFYPILFAIILGLVQYWNEKISFRNKSSLFGSISLVAGVSVAYVFLFLLPDMYQRFGGVNRWIFIFVLIGFSFVHVAEKYLYRHLKGWARVWREKEIHYIVLFLYHLFIGVFSVFVFQKSFVDGFLFYLPIIFYSAVGRVSFAEVHHNIRNQKVFRIFIALAALIGVIVGPFFSEVQPFYNAFIAFVIGSFLYIALTDFIPAKDKGKPSLFLLGALLYTLLIMTTWLIE